jgi:hypothetical protein
MAKKCTPCLGEDIKQLLQTLGDPDVDKILKEIEDCPIATEIELCPVTKGKRAPSAYQQFISVCMKAKAPEGMAFGDAPKYMKQCAAEWKEHKAQ